MKNKFQAVDRSLLHTKKSMNINRWDNVPAIRILKRNEHHQDLMVAPDAFSKEECEEIISDGSTNLWEEAKAYKIANDKEDPYGESSKRRVSDVTWIDISKPKFNWIYDRIVGYVENTNNNVWRYDLPKPYLVQGLQLGKYKKDSHFDWHTDYSAGSASTRRITLVVQLTNPNEYEGGKFEIFNGNRKTEMDHMLNNQGNMLLFPSHIWHKVTPLTKGVRFSLTGWILGNTII